jgi:hypothetical protein
MVGFYDRQHLLYLHGFFFGRALCGVLLMHDVFCWILINNGIGVEDKYQ